MGGHIRGRLRRSHETAHGRPVYLIEVVDTQRGVVLHRDNACGFEGCLNELRFNVGICREAFHMGVLAKRTWCS